MVSQPLTATETARAIEASWEIGLLRYKLRYNQPIVYDGIKQANPLEIFVELCSRGFGKTTIGATLGLEGIRQEEPGNVIMLSSSLKKQRLLVEPKFDFLLRDCPTRFRPIAHRQDSYYTDPVTRNNLYLFAGEHKKVNDIRGIHNVKLVLIDEAGFFGSEEDAMPLDYLIDAVITPMFQHSKMARVIAYSSPPETPQHPFEDLYNQARLAGCFAKHTIYESGLPAEKIEEMHRRTKDPLVWRREYLCEFVIDEATMIVPEFNRAAHVQEVKDPEYLRWLHKGSGADLGVSDKTYECFGYYDFPRHKIVVKREFWLEGAEVRTDNFAARHRQIATDIGFMTKGGEAVKPCSFWSDNSNLMLLNDLAHLHHIYVNPTEKENKAEWINLLRIMFQQGEIQIDPSCKLLIATLEGGYWKDGFKKDYARTKALGHMDAIDGLLYFVRNLNTSANPFPLDWNMGAGQRFSPATHVYPQDWEKQPHTAEGAALQKVFSKGRYMRPGHQSTKIRGGLS